MITKLEADDLGRFLSNTERQQVLDARAALEMVVGPAEEASEEEHDDTPKGAFNTPKTSFWDLPKWGKDWITNLPRAERDEKTKDLLTVIEDLGEAEAKKMFLKDESDDSATVPRPKRATRTSRMAGTAASLVKEAASA